jgi:hypothetical protein
MKKIIQISSAANEAARESDLFCLTEDGKVYQYGYDGWRELYNKVEKKELPTTL